MKIQIKRLTKTAIIPKYWRAGDVGCDLHADIPIDDKHIVVWPGYAELIPTGISMAIPSGFGGFILPKSGEGHKRGLILGNLTGVIDQGYRGQIFVSVWNRSDHHIKIKPGDRIAQLVFKAIAIAEFDDVGDGHLDSTDRGEGGFGSTGIDCEGIDLSQIGIE